MTGGIGTLAYMAPEQLGPLSETADPARPARHDARTDVWGLGATLYELLTLRLPFPGQSAKEVARKIVSEPPERLNGSIPRELKAICLKALEKDPGKRYESAAALAADLRRWLEIRPTVAGESAIRRKAGRLFGGAWVWLRRLGFWSRRRRRPRSPPVCSQLFSSVSWCGSVNRLNLANARAETAQVRRGPAHEGRARRSRESSRSSRCHSSAGRSGRWTGSRRAGSTSAPSAEAAHLPIRSSKARPPRLWRGSTPAW